MAEIYLTGVAREQVPANGENDEYVGKDKGTQDIGFAVDSRDEEKEQEENQGYQSPRDSQHISLEILKQSPYQL